MERTYGWLELLTPRDRFAHLQVLLMHLNPSQRTRPHRHPSEELFFVLSGSVLLETQDPPTVRALSLREWASVESMVVHTLRSEAAEESATLLIALSPPRQESQVQYLAQDG